MDDHNRPQAQLARALLFCGLAAAAVAAAYAILAHSLAAGLATLATYVVVAALLWSARARLPDAPLSLATRLTLTRATITAALAGLAVAPALAHSLAWGVLAAAALELGLDTADGAVARRRGETSELGAIFDGEVDALFVLVLSVLAFHTGRHDGAPAAFVLALGGFRYAFLAAALVFPVLRGEVPSSLRAKIICDVVIGVLLFGVAPFTPVAARTPLAAMALALLAWSFSFDVRYLLSVRARSRQRRS